MRPSRVWVSRSELVYVGPALGRRVHRTAVPRVLLALDEPFVLRSRAGERRLPWAYVGAREEQQVISTGTWWMVCYTSPGSLRDLHCREHPPQELDELVDLARAGRVHALLTTLGPEGQAPSRLSPVVEAVLADPLHPWSADEAATMLGWSVSYFVRQFTGVVGTTFRRFVRWARLLIATRAIADSNLTDAAALAEFSSPSHLSDTVRDTLGFTPTDLLRTGAKIEAI